jgi:hypothetical protein
MATGTASRLPNIIRTLIAVQSSVGYLRCPGDAPEPAASFFLMPLSKSRLLGVVALLMCSVASLAADGNGNGIVDVADYAVWRDNLGAGQGCGSAANVPEPSSGLLAICAVLLALGAKSKKLFRN